MSYVYAVAEMITLLCLPTALLDMAMNGSKNASWAPYGLGLSFISIGVMALT